MGKAKKEVVEEVVEVPAQNNGQVVQHLDKDLNDPRLKETVDGNSQPVVDINQPL